MIREVGASIGRIVLDGLGRAASRLQEQRELSADVLESDDAYLVVFDAPGATAEDLAVRFDDGTVSIEIDRFREFYEGYEMVFPGRGLSLGGVAELPEEAAIDADRADATLTEHGTLEVLLPKVGAETVDTTDDTSTDVETADDLADELESDSNPDSDTTDPE